MLQIQLRVLALAVAVLEPRASALPAVEQIHGVWHGRSDCVKAPDNAACNDEVVVYTFADSPENPGEVTLTADKIVDGDRGTMYVAQFKLAADGSWMSEFQTARAHGRWRYVITGDTMIGTLSLLPSGRVVRHISLKKGDPEVGRQSDIDPRKRSTRGQGIVRRELSAAPEKLTSGDSPTSG